MEETASKYHTPADYLKVFFRRKWLVVVPAYIGLIVGIVAAFVIPKTWQSSTIILIEEPKIINPLIQGLAVSTTAIQRMQSIREILLGWNSLVDLTRKLNLAKDVKNQVDFENLILGLRKKISVQMSAPGRTGLSGASIVQIAYSGDNPQEARLVAQTLTDILMEKNVESQTKETDVAIKFIQEQLDIYKRKVKESEIAKMEDSLKALLQDSTEQHPMVKELREKINIAKKELESGEFEIKGSDQPTNEATKEALQQELDKIIKQETDNALTASTTGQPEPPTDANSAIYKLMLMDKVEEATAKDTNVNSEIYNMLLQKLETAKITQRLEASRSGTRYTILDPPRLPLRPSKPNKPLVVLIGLAIGAASGAGLVFGREFLDQSILDIEDAKLSLDLPVLGAISRITTQDEVDRQKQRTRTAVTVTIALSVITLVTGILFSLFKR